MNNKSKQTGFSLIEVLAAFVIACTGLALLYNIQSNANRITVVSREYAIANGLAQSLIAEGSIQEGATATSTRDNFEGKYHWQIQYQPVSDGNLELLEINLLIEWPSVDQQRSLQVSTIKPLFIPDISSL